MKTIIRRLFIIKLPVLIMMFQMASCASTEGKKQKEAPSIAASAKAQKETSSAPAENKPVGGTRFVTTTITNNESMEGNIPSDVLNETLLAMDELVRKSPDNVSLNVTYMGLLRMYNQNHSLQDSHLRRAGAEGAKNVWFLLEAAYAAMARNDFSMADYMLGRAQKVAKDNPVARTAIQHATGVRLYLDGKPQAGMYEMKKAANSEQPFFPSLLTVGFWTLRTGDYKTAEHMFSLASQIVPNSIYVRLGTAAVFRVQGRAADAIPILSALVKLKSNDKRMMWNYALALSEGDQAQQKQALDVLGKTLQMPGAGEIDGRINTLLTKLQTTVSVSEKSAAVKPQAGGSAAGAAPAVATPAPAGVK